VLLALARQAQGDLPCALELLAEVAAEPTGQSLLFARRNAVACYAAALVAAERHEEGLAWARRAVSIPGEDVRSSVYSRRVLAVALRATGQVDEARAVAATAARDAHATQQVSERAAADAILAALS
jgi:hypothetical protein